MCSSKTKLQKSASMNARPVLHPNRAPLLERRNSFRNPSSPTNTLSLRDYCNNGSKLLPLPLPLKSYTPPASPTTPPPLQPVRKINDQPKNSKTTSTFKKSSSFKYTSSAIVEAPGTIAAARREQVAIIQEQRKMRIAHYGRTTKAPSGKPDHDHHNIINDHLTTSSSLPTNSNALQLQVLQDKRCSFITPNSDPIYVAYHDEEWGVPVHDDKLLFELLVLTGAQVGSDWTSVLRKREDFRDAFSGFDPEIVSKLSEKKMTSISSEYCIEMSLVRGVVDNSNRILEIKKELGSFDKYLWGFVNGKPIITQYKLCNKIPVKTSKSETISKDMIRRGFRQVGPTVIHSFMQAAGLTNDHLITCPRHFSTLIN